MPQPSPAVRRSDGLRASRVRDGRAPPRESRRRSADPWLSRTPSPHLGKRRGRRAYGIGAVVSQSGCTVPGRFWREAARARFPLVPPFLPTHSYRRILEAFRSGKTPAKVSQSPYCANAASTALSNSAASGVTAGSKRLITLPFVSTRNLVKFHLISPPVRGLTDLSVRYWYSGVVSVPFTDTLLIMGNVTW